MIKIKSIEKNFINKSQEFVLSKKISKKEQENLLNEFQYLLIVGWLDKRCVIKNNSIGLIKQHGKNGMQYIKQEFILSMKSIKSMSDFNKLTINKQHTLLSKQLHSSIVKKDLSRYVKGHVYKESKLKDILNKIDTNKTFMENLENIIKNDVFKNNKDNLFLHFLNKKGLLYYPAHKLVLNKTSRHNRIYTISKSDILYLNHMHNLYDENKIKRHEFQKFNELHNRVMQCSNLKNITDIDRDILFDFIDYNHNKKIQDSNETRIFSEGSLYRNWIAHIINFSILNKGRIKKEIPYSMYKSKFMLPTISRKVRDFEYIKNTELEDWIEPMELFIKKTDVSIDRCYLNLTTWINYLQSLDNMPRNVEEIKRDIHINNIKDLNKNTYWKYLQELDCNESSKRQRISTLRNFFLFYQANLNHKIIVPIDPKTDYWEEKLRRRKTTRMPLDSEIVDDLKELLISNNYEWMKSLNSDLCTIRTIYVNNKLHKDVFCPSIANALYLLLTIPLRISEAMLVDSGYGDEFIYSFQTNKMIKNKTKNVIKNRQMGILQEAIYNSIKKEKTLVLRICTDKIQEDKRDIPFVPTDLLEVLKNQYQFYKKYNKNPKIVIEQDYKKNAFNYKKDSKIFPLFTDLTKNEDTPINQQKLRRIWSLLCHELENRYKKKGYDIELTRGKMQSGEPKYIYDIHSLRVTGVTNFIERGVPIHIIQENLVGHKTVLMTSYYNKQSFFEQRKILEDAYNKRREIPNYRKMDEIEKNNFKKNLFSNNLGEGIAESWLNKNDAGIKISFSGVCSGGLCEEGSFLTDTSGKSLPVPRGWRNPSCFQCKYWLTGSDFLLGQQLEFNQLTEDLHNKAKELESLRKEFNIAEKKDSINKNILKGEIDKETDIWYNMLVEWQNRLNFMEKSLSMLNTKKDDKSLIAGTHNKFELKKDALPIERKINLSLASEYFPEMAIKNKMTIFEMERVLGKFLKINKYPHINIEINSKQKLNMMNNMFGILLETLNCENREMKLLGISPLDTEEKNILNKQINSLSINKLLENEDE